MRTELEDALLPLLLSFTARLSVLPCGSTKKKCWSGEGFSRSFAIPGQLRRRNSRTAAASSVVKATEARRWFGKG